MPASNIENALAELNRQLADKPIARLAFMQLAKDRRHELIKHIAEAKKPTDRRARIDKSISLLETHWALGKIKH